MQARPTFLYDADCGVCSDFKRLVAFFDASHSVDFVPISQAARSGLLDSMPRSRWFSSSHMVYSDGTMASGGDSLIALLSLLPGGRVPSRLFRRLPAGRSLARRFYGVISRSHETACGILGGRAEMELDVPVAWLPQ